MARRRQPYDPNSVKRHDRTGAAFYAHLPAGRAIAVEIEGIGRLENDILPQSNSRST